MEDEKLEDLTLKMEVFQEVVVRHLQTMRRDIETWKKEMEEKFKGQLEESMSGMDEKFKSRLEESMSSLGNLQSTSSFMMEDEEDPVHCDGPSKTSGPKVCEGVPAKVPKITPHNFKIPVDIEDCKEDVRAKIQPFADAKLCRNSMLTYAQAAYFNYMFSENEGKPNDHVVSVMIVGGIEDKIWPKGWMPPDSRANDFAAFLLDKVKNKRKAIKRAKFQKEMQDMLFTTITSDV